MLIALHAIDSTLEAPFLPASWQQIRTTDTTFGTTAVNSIAYDGSLRLVAVGNSGKIAYSDNSGFNWTQVGSPFQESNIYAISYGNGIFIAGGSAGKIATSSNGIDWFIQDSGFGAGAILGVSYVESSGVWIIAGANGKLATSTDTVNWTLRSSSFGITFINSVRSLENSVIAVGYDGKLATSTDGITWTQRASSFVTSTIFDTAYSSNEAVYIAVGDSGKVAFSSDSISWSQIFPQSSFGASSIRAISTTDETYVAAGSAGKVGTAIDFRSWTLRDAGFGLSTVNDLLVINNNTAVAVGDGGKIAVSL